MFDDLSFATKEVTVQALFVKFGGKWAEVRSLLDLLVAVYVRETNPERYPDPLVISDKDLEQYLLENRILSKQGDTFVIGENYSAFGNKLEAAYLPDEEATKE